MSTRQHKIVHIDHMDNPLKQLVTPKQVAQAINVSESSLKRWCDRGLLKTVRTAGGHRRVAVADVVEFLRKSGHDLVRPALLGLPSTTGQGALAVARARDQMCDALLAGDVELCRRIAFDLHLAGKSVSVVCDQVLAASMHDIGDRWECEEAEIYQERRATMLCLRLLSELRSTIPAPAETKPSALGGTPECDPYLIPTTMAEIVLRQNGWRAQSLGSRLPFPTLVAAIREVRPQLFWLSVSHLEDADRFLAEYRAFYEEVRAEVAVVVGGRALTESLRRQMEYSAYGDNMQHLEAFAQTLKRSFRAERRVENSAAARKAKPSRTGNSF
jgi:excisionase family DNA binding protein